MKFIHSDSVTWIKKIPFESDHCEIWEADVLDKDQGKRAYVRKFGPFSLNEQIEMFTKAALEIISRVSRCQYVCDFYGVFTSGLYVCVVSAYFDDSLSDLIRKSGGISHEKIRKYCTQLCAGIASLHENGLFLGNFNPSNVLIDTHDNCLLTDIGFCKELYAIQKNGEARGGSYYHFSPEVIDAAQFGGVSVKTDSWNFALIMIEMSTGSKAWADLDRRVFEELIMNGEIPDIPLLPEPINNLVVRCLSLEPLDRPNFQEMLPTFRRQWSSVCTIDNRIQLNATCSIFIDGQNPVVSSDIAVKGDAPKLSRSAMGLSGSLSQTASAPTSAVHDIAAEANMHIHNRDPQITCAHDLKSKGEESLPLSSKTLTVSSTQQCTIGCHGLDDRHESSNSTYVQGNDVMLSQDDIQELRALKSEWKSLRSSFSEQLHAARQEKQDAERIAEAQRTECDKLREILKRKHEVLESFSKKSQEQEAVANQYRAEHAKAKETAVRLTQENCSLAHCMKLLRDGLSCTIQEVRGVVDEIRCLGECQVECCKAHSASVRERARLQIEVDRLMLSCDRCEETSKCEKARACALQQDVAVMQAENRKILEMFEAEQKMCVTSTGYIERLLQKVTSLELEVNTLKTDLKAKIEEVTREQDQYAMHKKIWETEKTLLVSKSEDESNQRRKLTCDDPLMEIAFEKYANMCCACLSILRRCRDSTAERRALVIDRCAEGLLDKHPNDISLANDICSEIQGFIASAVKNPQSSQNVDITTGSEMANISSLASAARVNGRPHQAEALYQLAVLSYRVQEAQQSLVKAQGEGELLRDCEGRSETGQNLPLLLEQKVLSGNPSAHTNHDLQRSCSSEASPATFATQNEHVSLNPAPGQIQFFSAGLECHRTSSLRSFSNECSTLPIGSSSGSLRYLPTDISNSHRSPFRTNSYNSEYHPHCSQLNPEDALIRKDSNLQEHIQDKRLVLGLVLDGDCILKVFPGSLSYLAGLKVGDVIISINDKVVNTRSAVHVLREVTDQVSQNQITFPAHWDASGISISVRRNGSSGIVRCSILGSRA